MRDIYLIDFENVASEGLSGITFLAPEDEVIIFYSNNSNRLSMKMHILIGKSVCKCNYFEVTVGGKNALDHQISTWLGYLIGTRAAERNYYIVSKDMGYKFVASFWTESAMHPSVRCIDSIRAASRPERSRKSLKTEEEQLQLDAPEPVAELAQPEPVLRLQEAPAVSAEAPEAEAVQEPASPMEPQAPETTPEPMPEPAPEPPKATHRRSFFGVVLPDWPEKKAEPAPIEQPQPEAPMPEPAAEPAAAPEEPVEETPVAPETQPAAQAESGGEWPPLEDEPHEGDAPPSRSRSRSRSRRGRTRSNHSAAKESAETVESREPTKSEKKSEAKAEKKQEKKPEPKADKKPERKQEKNPAPKAEKKSEPKADKKPRQEKKPEPKKVDISGLIAPYPGLQEQHLQQLIADGKKQVLCNTLRKQLGQEKGLALYNEIKKIAWK